LISEDNEVFYIRYIKCEINFKNYLVKIYAQMYEKKIAIEYNNCKVLFVQVVIKKLYIILYMKYIIILYGI